MNRKMVSYLIVLSCQLSLFLAVLQGQNTRDSITYYAQKVIKPAHSDDLLQAYAFFEKQNTRARQNADTLSQIYNQYLLSLIALDLGMVFESETTIARNLALLDALPKTRNTSGDYKRTYNLLGRIYRQLQHPDQGIHYYTASLNHAEKTSDSIILFNNIGMIYKELKKTDSAIAYYKKAHALSLKNGDSLQYARVLNNWFSMEPLKNKPSAIDTLQKAARLRQALGDNKGLYSSYRNLAKVLLSNPNASLAQKYADSALQLAMQINSLSFLKDAYTLQLQLKNDSLATAFLKVTDSIEKLEHQEQNSFASLKYNVAKEHELTLASKLEQEKERAEKQRFQALVVIVLIIAFFVIYINHLRYKRAKELEIYNTETRLSKKVHDEVANDVYRVMTKLQAPEAPGPDILDDLEGIYTKTRNISHENSTIDLTENFGETLNDLLFSYHSDDCNIITKYNDTLNWQLISSTKKRLIYRVLQELLTNMKKHSGATLVVLTFTQKGKKISVQYRDNGAGTTLSKKNGLQNVENRIFALNGNITFESKPGNGFKAGFTV